MILYHGSYTKIAKPQSRPGLQIRADDKKLQNDNLLIRD